MIPGVVQQEGGKGGGGGWRNLVSVTLQVHVSAISEIGPAVQSRSNFKVTSLLV